MARSHPTTLSSVVSALDTQASSLYTPHDPRRVSIAPGQHTGKRETVAWAGKIAARMQRRLGCFSSQSWYPMTRSEENLVWMDMEMTGLDPETCSILEVGALITTAELEPLADGLCLPIAQPEDVLRSMDPWCVRQHTKSGLIDRVRQSGVALQDAEEALLRLIRRFCYKKKSPLCGNSICQDRRFLIRYMPRVEDHLHYRNIDVSSIKELVCRWYPEELHFAKKTHAHRALDDIHESLAELEYYWKRLFVTVPHT